MAHHHLAVSKISSSVLRSCALICSTIERRRHPVDNCIEKLLYAFIFEGRTAKNRIEFVCANTFTDDCMDFFCCQRIWIFKHFCHECFIRLHRWLQALLRVLHAFFCTCSRRSAGISVSSQSAPSVSSWKIESFHRDEIDHSFEFRFCTDWAVDRNGIGMELFAHCFDCIEEVSSRAVHLVDESRYEERHICRLDAIQFQIEVQHRIRSRIQRQQPSRTRKERSTSIVKSTWPGVSMILILDPFQKTVVAAEVIVIPRSCSCSIQSMVAAPSCTSPMR